MIYYPLSVLMLAGIGNINISTPDDLPSFKKLETGRDLECTFLQSPTKSRWIGTSIHIREEFIGDDDVCLVLGDNIFYGHGFTDLLSIIKKCKRRKSYSFWVLCSRTSTLWRLISIKKEKH